MSLKTKSCGQPPPESADPGQRFVLAKIGLRFEDARDPALFLDSPLFMLGLFRAPENWALYQIGMAMKRYGGAPLRVDAPHAPFVKVPSANGTYLTCFCGFPRYDCALAIPVPLDEICSQEPLDIWNGFRSVALQAFGDLSSHDPMAILLSGPDEGLFGGDIDDGESGSQIGSLLRSAIEKIHLGILLPSCDSSLPDSKSI